MGIEGPLVRKGDDRRTPRRRRGEPGNQRQASHSWTRHPPISFRVRTSTLARQQRQTVVGPLLRWAFQGRVLERSPLEASEELHVRGRRFVGCSSLDQNRPVNK